MSFKIQPCLVVSAVGLAVLIGGCPFVRVRAVDEARLVSLRAEIEAIVAASSCSGDGDCGTRAVGRACGPVSFYVAYAPAAVDEAALAETIEEYNDLEGYMARRGDFICTNMVPAAPTVRCENTVCVAVQPAGP